MKKVRRGLWSRIQTMAKTTEVKKVVWFEEDLSWFITDQNTYPPTNKEGYPVGFSVENLLQGWDCDNGEITTAKGLNELVIYLVERAADEQKKENELYQ